MATNNPRLIYVQPGELRVPPDRMDGADPFKLYDQIAEFGASTKDMPPLQATRGADGELMINDGVTRATRLHQLAPQATVPVEVIDIRPDWDLTGLPRVKETEP